MTTPEQPALPWWQDRLLIAVAVVVLGWGALSLTWPLSGDAGVFAWMADTVLRGGAPYVDAWDTKGPGAWMPSLLVQALFGRTSWGIRIFDIAMLVAALAALRGISRRLGQPGDGRVAITLYALWYTSLDYWQSAQPDGWVASWLIVACWCALTGGAAGAVAAGALLGVSVLVKPFYIGYIVVLWIIVGTSRGRIARQRVSHAVLILAGTGASIGLLLFATRMWNGLDGFWEVQRWNRDVYARLGDPWMTRIPALVRGMVLSPWGIVAPIALFGAIRPTRAHRRTITALTVGLLGAIAGVMLQSKGWQYHWLPMLPFLALLADIGFAALRAETAGEIAGRFRWLALLLAFGVAGLNPLQQFYRYARSRASAQTIATYEQREFREYGRYPGSLYTIVDSLKALQPNSPARILVWALNPAPQFLAGLPTPTRFGVVRPLFDGADTPFRGEYRAQFERELRTAPPRWWIQPTAVLMARDEQLRQQDIRTYGELASYRQWYRLAGATEEWEVYEFVESQRVAAQR